MDTQNLRTELDELWTTQDLIKRFRVTAMTIRQWRQREGRALPALVLKGAGRDAVRFVPREVIAWAEQHKVRMWK